MAARNPPSPPRRDARGRTFATATPATTGGLYRPVLTDKSKRTPGLVTIRVCSVPAGPEVAKGTARGPSGMISPEKMTSASSIHSLRHHVCLAGEHRQGERFVPAAGLRKDVRASVARR